MAPQTINVPVNLLSLGKWFVVLLRPYLGGQANSCLFIDGGGVRGVSELVMLHKIMQRVQEIEQLTELPKPCDYFHIIGGTSTGG